MPQSSHTKGISKKRLTYYSNIKNSGEDIIDDIIAEDFHAASTYKKRVFDGDMILGTADPRNLQAILATQFKDFETGKRRRSQFYPILGKSIFSSDGAFWEHSRALFRPAFARENINDLDATDHAADNLIKAAGPTDASGWTANVDLMPLLFNFTMDTASDFLFGESVEAQASAIRAKYGDHATPTKQVASAGEMASSQEFLEAFQTIGDYVLNRIRLQSLYWLADGIKFRRAIKVGRHVIEHFVQKAIETTNDEKSQGKKDSLLSRLATQTHDREELRNQTLAILFAGRDTTAALLGWCLMRLALHPDYLTKLRNLILQEFSPGEPITFAQLKGCRPLQHFLNEVLRVHSVVPINNRVAVKNTTLPYGGGPDQRSPVAVKKGQTVVFSVYVMHRRKDLWGEDALEFKPERWERRVPAWQFLPFLGGPRICIGQQFALTEASYVLVRMLQHFDAIEPIDKADMWKMRKGMGLTMWPGDGVKVRLHKA